MELPQVPDSPAPTAPTGPHKFRVKFLDGPAAGITHEYDKESEIVRYGMWKYDHTHKRDGDYWLFVRRMNSRGARRVVRALTGMYGKDPRMEEKKQPNRVIKRGRNEPCWCGSGMKFKRCHGAAS
jgi:hypothetical protein